MQKSSSRTFDLKDDSNEELSDIISLQSITLTNESTKMNKSEPFSSMIEESRILSSSSSKSTKSQESDNFSEPKSSEQNCQETIEVNKNYTNEKINLLKVTVENVTESSEDEFEKFKRPPNKKESIPM